MKNKDILRESIKIKIEEGALDNLSPFLQQMYFGKSAYKIDKDGNIKWLTTQELLNLGIDGK